MGRGFAFRHAKRMGSIARTIEGLLGEGLGLGVLGWSVSRSTDQRAGLC